MMQHSITGSLGVTLPSKRRSEPDLTLEEESESDEASPSEYQYICTSLVSSRVRHLNDIVVMTMSGNQVSMEVDRAKLSD